MHPNGQHVDYPAPRSKFRCGDLRVEPELLECVPRYSLVRWIVCHFTNATFRADRWLSEHAHEGHRYVIETIPAEGVTHVRRVGR